MWMRPATHKLIKRKHRFHTKYLNTKSDTDKAAYKNIRSKVTSETRKDRLAFERNISKEIKNDNKLFWRYVNSTRLTKVLIPDLDKPDCSKAEVLNAQFSSVFTEEDTSNIPTQEDLHIESPLTDFTITTEVVKKK